MITCWSTKNPNNDPSHPTVVLARQGLRVYYSNLNLIYAPIDIDPSGMEIEYVKGFDRES